LISACSNSNQLEVIRAIIHPDSWDLIKYAVNNAKKEIFQLTANQRSYAWREYYEFLETYNLLVKGSLMNRLQYGYAITVHQSQGGTFPNCFVDTSNTFGCRDNVMRNKLGQYHCQLENPRKITPIPYIGRLGIFEVPDDLVMEVVA
jgi:hypothetical protein